MVKAWVKAVQKCLLNRPPGSLAEIGKELEDESLFRTMILNSRGRLKDPQLTMFLQGDHVVGYNLPLT